MYLHIICVVSVKCKLDIIASKSVSDPNLINGFLKTLRKFSIPCPSPVLMYNLTFWLCSVFLNYVEK